MSRLVSCGATRAKNTVEQGHQEYQKAPCFVSEFATYPFPIEGARNPRDVKAALAPEVDTWDNSTDATKHALQDFAAFHRGGICRDAVEVPIDLDGVLIAIG